MFPGVNLSDRDKGWEQNYREPDVAVFLRDGKAINCGTHWRGAADFLVEIISPGERTREKIPFYSSLGVVELLIIDRDPWTLELYRHQNGQLAKVGQSTLAAARSPRQPDGRPDVSTPARRTAAANSGDASRPAIGNGKSEALTVMNIRFTRLPPHWSYLVSRRDIRTSGQYACRRTNC